MKLKELIHSKSLTHRKHYLFVIIVIDIIIFFVMPVPRTVPGIQVAPNNTFVNK